MSLCHLGGQLSRVRLSVTRERPSLSDQRPRWRSGVGVGRG